MGQARLRDVIAGSTLKPQRIALPPFFNVCLPLLLRKQKNVTAFALFICKMCARNFLGKKKHLKMIQVLEKQKDKI